MKCKVKDKKAAVDEKISACHKSQEMRFFKS